MRITSCDNCGAVMDIDKLTFESKWVFDGEWEINPMYDHEGNPDKKPAAKCINCSEPIKETGWEFV